MAGRPEVNRRKWRERETESKSISKQKSRRAALRVRETRPADSDINETNRIRRAQWETKESTNGSPKPEEKGERMDEEATKKEAR